MVEIKVKHRETGATARLAARGRATLQTATGGELEVVTGVSEAGFNPLDLLYSSLAACLVLSIKGAVVKLQHLEKFHDVEVQISGEKAHEGPSRVESLKAAITIHGDFDDRQRHDIVALAKELCTVSNTLALSPSLAISVHAG
ncbi:OsmC family protein [Rhizobium helianthi]|uniref:OsmC family protein n=1 Tax=Rhizobium helianthi TaxID=1132695 RepID=A0ABW4M1K6_9HYPH